METYYGVVVIMDMVRLFFKYNSFIYFGGILYVRLHGSENVTRSSIGKAVSSKCVTFKFWVNYLFNFCRGGSTSVPLIVDLTI